MPRIFYSLLLVALMFFCTAPAATAQDDPFLVKGVTVDVSAKNAVQARAKAFGEARRKAYEMLAETRSPAPPGMTLAIPSDGYISSVVRDVEVVSEKLSSTRYVATFDVRFSPSVAHSFRYAAVTVTPPAEENAPADEVQQDQQTQTVQPQTAPTPDAAQAVASVTPAPVSEADVVYSPKTGGVVTLNGAPVQASVPVAALPDAPAAATGPQPILLLPWYGPVSRQVLWGDENPFRAAWDKYAATASTGDRQIIVPLGDAADMRDYEPMIPQGGSAGLERLMARYRVSEALIAVAEPQDQALSVRLYRFDGRRIMPITTIDTAAVTPQDDLPARAVAATAAAINAMPAQGTPAQEFSQQAMPVENPQTIMNTGNQKYATIARFSGLQQWIAMRNTLRSLPGIGNLDVLSISPASATIRFNYAGDTGALQNLLAQNGMTLVPVPQGEVPYELRMGRVF